jgi:galactose mutarotase-like enzyme
MTLIQRQHPYPHWEFEEAGSGDLLRVVPERGGLIAGWRSGGIEQLYLDQERFLDPALSVRGGIPVLFPICGGLPAGSLNLPQHGFARDLPWRLEPLADGRGVAMVLEDSEQSRRAYPYAFCLTLEVRLAEAALEFSITVENRSTTSMPFSFGLHPYFQVSGLDGLRIEGLPPCSLDQVTMTQVNSEQHVDLMAEGIDMLSQPSGAVRLVDGPGHRFVELQPSGPLDLVVIWTDPPRSMVCLEPWTAPRGSLVSGDRRVDLAPGGRQHLSTRYRVGVECY